MKPNTGEKMPPRIINGVRFFNFPIGAVYLIADKEYGKTYRLTIVGATYNSNSHTEYYTCKQDGIDMPTPISANRIKYLTSRYLVSQEFIGQYMIFPLTHEEVKYFFEVQNTQEKERMDDLKKKVYEDDDYKSLVALYKVLNSKFIEATIKGRRDEASSIEIEIAGVKVQMQERARIAGFVPTVKCKCCHNTGFTERGNICPCAIERTKDIKIFYAKNHYVEDPL